MVLSGGKAGSSTGSSFSVINLFSYPYLFLEMWEVSKRIRFKIKALEIRFLYRIVGLLFIIRQSERVLEKNCCLFQSKRAS